MNPKPSIFFLAVFLLGWGGLVSDIFAQNSNHAILYLKLANKFIYVEAVADGRQGNFIIDTGCPGIVLNDRYFESILGARITYDINGQTEKKGGRYVDISLGNLDFRKKYAVVANLHNIEGVIPDIPIMGLIGEKLFKDYELAFDLPSGEVTLCRVDKEGSKLTPSLYQSAPTDTFNLVLKGHLPCIKVQIGEVVLRFAIDSGASVNVLRPKSLEKISPYLKAQRKARLSGLLSQRTELFTVGVLMDMELGSTSYLPMETVVRSIEYYNYKLAGPKVDGILGYPFLVQYKTAINLRRKELYIWDKEKKDSCSTKKKVIVKNR